VEDDVLDLDVIEKLIARTTDTGSEGDGRGLRQLVDELANLSLAPGSVVLISLGNGVRLLRTLFAAILAGYVPVLLAPSTPASRMEELITHLRPALLIGNGTVGRINGTRVRVDGGHGVLPDVQPRLHAPGQMILLTSGTSGSATGCLHDTRSLLRNARLHADSIGLTADDTLLVVLPVYYSFALVAQVFAALVSGASLVLSGPPFTVSGYRRCLSDHAVTVTSLTPSLVADLLAQDGRLSAPVRTLTVGGQALPPGHPALLLERNPGLALYLTYGLTEAGPRVTTLAAHQEPPARHRSVGVPLSGIGLSLRDVGRGPEEQEVLVASPAVYRERVGAPPAPGTRRGGLVSPGVVATGDLGYLEDGYLFLRGRTTDFAIIRGQKVSLASVRRAAESLDGVVRAVARVDSEADLYRLDLLVNRPSLAEADLRRQLFGLLSSHERPSEITLQLAPTDILLK
jgi:acyl-CoA synthetase (AMP-forming)/AMP-acid ligase II